jgi:hypothetical protein
MKVYDIIEEAKKIRPGYEWDSEVVENWIDRVDASIQLEVALKNPLRIRKCIPDLWDKDKLYRVGDRVHLVVSGKKRIYVATTDTVNINPKEYPQCWKEVEYDTYVGHPHDKLYVSYIIAMMDYATRDFNQYASDYAIYNAEAEEFAKWWQRKYRYNFVEGSDPYEADIRRADKL